jgi:hypothetical protein
MNLIVSYDEIDICIWDQFLNSYVCMKSCMNRKDYVCTIKSLFRRFMAENPHTNMVTVQYENLIQNRIQYL